VDEALAEAVAEATKGRGFVRIEGLVEIQVCWMSTDPLDPSQPDLDNMLKPLIDALNETVIDDDRQVHRIFAEKADINSPPRLVDKIAGVLQDDPRYVETGEVIVVCLRTFLPEYQL
jgi:Holliday junction resolvase RusA-like endonuclease